MIEQLYRDKYGEKIKMVYRRSGSIHNAEDVVQEAFARAIRYFDSFIGETEEDLNRWFDRILRRCLYDFKRIEIKQGMTQDEIEKADPDADITYTYGVENRTAEEIVEEIGNQKGDRRNLLHMYFLKGYTMKDIAMVMDMTPKQVDNVVAYFKKQMQEKYA